MPKVGRKEVLTEEVAKRICKMIERMPDATVPVTWVNVISHVKKSLRVEVGRQTLSQKEWNGRKLIAEAYDLAKEVQRRKKTDTAPKYVTAGRPALQRRIADLEAKVLALKDELEQVRAQQFDALNAFLNTRCDLRKLLDAVRD